MMVVIYRTDFCRWSPISIFEWLRNGGATVFVFPKILSGSFYFSFPVFNFYLFTHLLNAHILYLAI